MITLATTSESAQLDAYVGARPDANVYQLSAWRRIIEGVFGNRCYCLVSRAGDGGINGLMPMARLQSWLFGDFLVSMPYVNYGGPCADDHAVAGALIAEGARLAAEMGVRHLEVRTETEASYGFPVRASKVAMRLPLAASADDLWKALGSKLRSQVKRAQREAMTVHFGREEELDAFYSVMAANMRDIGSPIQSKRLFAAVLREFPESTVICVVRLGDVAIAAGFLLGFRGSVEIPWASSLKRYSRLSPNMLLYWSVLQYSCERGYTIFDFGRSSPDSGAHKFKAQWGAMPAPLYWHYWVPAGRSLPEITMTNPKYQLAIRMWQKLPVPVTKLIGPSIVKNLP